MAINQQPLGDPDEGLFDGRYELLGPLGGRGFYGEVWRAFDTTTGRTVALKLLDANETTPEDAWREATSLTSLESPHLLRVFGAAMAMDVPYIDTEIAEGGSLEEVASPLGVTEHLAARWGRQIAIGLSVCHRAGLVHRDVKPANVFLNAQGDALLGDFGKAALLDEERTAGCDGDPQIRAPELLKGARCTPESDVYAAGMTLHALLAGRLPFRFADFGGFKELREAAVQGPPAIRDVAPQVSRQMGRIVTRATAVDPSDRPSADEVAWALARVAVGSRYIQEVTPQSGQGREWLATPFGKAPVEVRVTAVSHTPNRWTLEAIRTSSGSRVRP
ncbi:MAG: serine/threonine-protein kinase [Actinomycetota bacterium]